MQATKRRQTRGNVEGGKGNFNDLAADYRPSLKFSSGRCWDVVCLVVLRET